jgi:type I restriction enzyme S subunit
MLPIQGQHKVDELMALCDRLEAEQADAGAAHARLVATLLGTLTQSADAAELAANWQRLAEHFDTLFTTEASLDALKQTILQLAVMGKLVPQDPNDEPASELLKRIAKERARLEATGKVGKSKLVLPVDEDERPFSLPSGWEWVRFAAVATTRLGKMLDAAKNRGELKPYLRNTNVQWFRFDLEDIKELRLDQGELIELRLETGDLLICEGGEPGRCAIWQADAEEMYFQKALHRARPDGGTLAAYLQIVLRQDAVSGWLEKYFTGATIKHFSGEKLAAYAIPLPPVAEQHRIVAKVDELLALVDRLKADLADSRARQERLAARLIESALQAA